MAPYSDSFSGTSLLYMCHANLETDTSGMRFWR